jgi:hypothetical protein
MIDFRYHLVSIVAVFLALAIGIVLGATELQGKTVDVLSETSNQLNSKLKAADSQLNNDAAQLGAADEFAQTNEALLVRGLLTGKRVVLVTEPGAPDSVVNGITKAVGLAGGSVTGQVALQTKFNDTSGATESTLNDINGTIAQTDGTALTSGSNQQTVNQEQAAQLIATAVLAGSPSAAVTQAQAQTLLSTYAQAGFLSVSQQPAQQPAATLAIVIPPASAPSDGGSDQANQVLVAVAQELAGASTATVVAGSLAGSVAGSAIATLRSSNVSGQVSTVDNADTAFGQVTAIQALATQMAGGKPGAYGVTGGSNAAGPSPAPTPGASVSASPSPSTSKEAKGRT